MAKTKPHRWYTVSMRKRSSCSFPWRICWLCGLVYLRNEETDKLVRRGCLGADED